MRVASTSARSERALYKRRVRPAARRSLGGGMALAGAGLSQLLLVPASVRPVQGLYGGYRDCLVVHGKEKVYGSIP